MREPTDPVDAAWLHMDEPTSPMVVTAVAWFDRPLDRARLREVLQERMIAPFPRFSQRVIQPTSGLRGLWEADPTFDLDRHLLPARLPAPGGRAELERLVSEIVSAALPHDRPLWTLHHVEGYGAGSALIARMHHAMADGFALATVLLSLGDTPAQRVVPRPRERLGRRRAAAERISVIPKAAAAFGKLVFARSDPATPLQGTPTLHKRAAWSGTWPLDAVKARARALDATINDLMMAALAGALRRWMTRRGAPPLDVRAFVPVDLRPPGPIPATLGNRFGLVYLKLPVGEPAPEARVAVTHARMERLKRSPEAVVAYGIMGLFGRIPSVFEGVLVDLLSAKGSLVATNMPGPREPLWIAGARLDGLRFWVPQAGHATLGVSILSYAGGIGIGVVGDVDVMPDPSELVEDFTEELAALGVPAPDQRT